MQIALLQTATLGRRAVVRTARQPANVVFPLIFPMLLLAVNAGGLRAETQLPGFPTDSFLAFALAVPFVQGALLATVNANVEFARDIQTGFLNRLALTPVRAMVLLVGQLGGLLTIALVQAVFYLVVGIAFGVRIESGVGGALLLLVLEGAIALAFASFGCWAALRTGSTEAVQGLFPVFFVFGTHEYVWGTTSITIRQRAVPNHLQGRVGSVNTICMFGGLVIGSAIGGLLATRYGVTSVFWYAFVGSALFVVLLWRELTRIAHSEDAS